MKQIIPPVDTKNKGIVPDDGILVAVAVALKKVESNGNVHGETIQVILQVRRVELRKRRVVKVDPKFGIQRKWKIMPTKMDDSKAKICR